MANIRSLFLATKKNRNTIRAAQPKHDSQLAKIYKINRT